MEGGGEKLSKEELEREFGPIDQLFSEAVDEPLEASLESIPIDPIAVTRQSGESNRSLVWSIRFFGLVLTGLLAVQTVSLMRDEQAVVAEPVSYRSDPAAVSEATGFLNSTLRSARIKLDEALYEDVVSLLEPYADASSSFSEDQRFQLFLTLARAHRRLGNAAKAQQYTLRATDQAVERREPGELFGYAQELRDQGRFEEARRVYASLLSRSDGLTGIQRESASIAEIRMADSLLAEAASKSGFPALPSVPARGKGGAP